MKKKTRFWVYCSRCDDSDDTVSVFYTRKQAIEFANKMKDTKIFKLIDIYGKKSPLDEGYFATKEPVLL